MPGGAEAANMNSRYHSKAKTGDAAYRNIYYQDQRSNNPDDVGITPPLKAEQANAARCLTPFSPMVEGEPVFSLEGAAAGILDENTEAPLGPGDLLSIQVELGEDFNGSYVLNASGQLDLPYLDPISLNGLRVEEAQNMVSNALVTAGFYQIGTALVTVEILERAPVKVFVSGAVFKPGAVVVNDVAAVRKLGTRVEAKGDDGFNRSLTASLRAAAGIRPDADLKNIVLLRGDVRLLLDLSGAIDGKKYRDVPLMEGDRVHVPSRDCFQEKLVRPSRVTQPGIKVYVSNLTQPATNNAASSIDLGGLEMPYGTRLSHAVTGGNCVGGTRGVNAERHVVLLSTNPITGEQESIQRAIEDLFQHPSKDNFDPFLLPNDRVACYDSRFVQYRAVVNTLNQVLAPIVSTGVTLNALK